MQGWYQNEGRDRGWLAEKRVISQLLLLGRRRSQAIHLTIEPLVPPSPFFKYVECVRETEILAEQQPGRESVLTPPLQDTPALVTPESTIRAKSAGVGIHFDA